MAALACVLAGCVNATGPASGAGDPVEVTTLAMNAGGSAPGRYAAVSTDPIHLGAFASWYGRGTDFEHVDEVTDEAPQDSAYLAVTDTTGCRVPDGVEVTRTGNDLEVRFTGGTDRQECVQQVGPGAYLAVPAETVDGVRTVNGEPLLDPAGPGALVENVPLDVGGFDPVAPAEFGTSAAGELRAAVLAARPDHAEAVTAALERVVPPGKRMFAFVVSGCLVEDVVLVLGLDRITADPILPRIPVDCDAAGYFLATFVVDADDVPEGATPSN